MKLKQSRILLCGALQALCQAAAGLTLDPQQVDEFIQHMVDEHRFERQALAELFARAAGQERILETIARPAERRPWHEYRPIFLTETRIQQGVAFWAEHEDLLNRAVDRYGVPAEIIVSILGVETAYGRITGSYRVLDSVATLAFHYPNRAAFFRSELEQFLLLAREERVDPLALTGSYAGAMGVPQFISSSFRNYAVDFDADGRRDIWSNMEDVVGSVAHYLSSHGWQRGEPVARRVTATPTPAWRELAASGTRPQLTGAQLNAAGINVPGTQDPQAHYSLIALELAEGALEYWAGWHNFYVITRYNNSALYAMAVFQLADEIRRRR